MSARFADVVGHKRALRVLRRSVLADRVHHAYLFVGPAGVGKRRAAMALAATLNCLNRQEDDEGADACGTCASCMKLAHGAHPDVLTLERDGRFIKIDQVRALQAKTNYRPHEGARRVVIVDEAETLREEAANALLKTLEEPRGDTLFVLVSSAPSRLLTTIVSRCQPVRFGPLAREEVVDVLVANGLERAEAETAAALSRGSVGQARHALESDVYQARADIASRLAGVWGASLASLLGWAEELGRSAATLPDVLDVTRSLLRDAAFAGSGVDASRWANRDIADEVRAIAAACTVEQLVAGVGRVDEAERMLRGNVNPRMVCESLLLGLAADPERPLARRIPA